MTETNSTLFLSIDDLVRLTGLQRPSAQIRWLYAHGYKFEVNGLKQPIVAIAEMNRKLVGGSTDRKQEPNWDAMNPAHRPKKEPQR